MGTGRVTLANLALVLGAFLPGCMGGLEVGSIYEMTRSPGKAIAVLTIDVKEKGVLGIPSYNAFTIVQGPDDREIARQRFLRGHQTAIALEPGEYCIREVISSYGMVGLLGIARTCDIVETDRWFVLNPDEVVYLGNLELKYRIGGAPGSLIVARQEEAVTVRDEYPAASEEFRKSHPHIQTPMAKRLLTTTSPGAQRVASLGQASGDRMVDGLIAALNKEDWPGRCAAARALGKTGVPRVVEPLVAAFQDKKLEVRIAVIEALGDTRDPRTIGPLIGEFKDYSGVFTRTSWPAVEALVKIGNAAVEPLIGAMNDKHQLTRVGAIHALGKIRDTRAVGPLLAVLGDPDVSIRYWAAGSLGLIGDRQAVDPLIKALGDREPLVRWAAAEALGGIGDLHAVPPLIATLGSRDPRRASLPQSSRQ